MAKERVRDVMSMGVTTLPADRTVTAAARLMEAENVGDVIVTENNAIRGVVTDRDITVRAVARGLDPKETSLGEICSDDPVTVDSSMPLKKAADVMRDHPVRRKDHAAEDLGRGGGGTQPAAGIEEAKVGWRRRIGGKPLPSARTQTPPSAESAQPHRIADTQSRRAPSRLRVPVATS